ncbi:MAG: hypothetical protein IPM39_15925 [Chloroflexi bacterium]|nr:hypothetical protein [Chloroflexota bacterium]
MSLGVKNGKNGAGQGRLPEQFVDDSFPLETAVSLPLPLPTQPLSELTQGCPHLGSPDDAATRFLFVSPAGTCHHAQPAEQVSLAHQQAFCLGADHEACPVFRRAASGPLPVELRGQLAEPRRWATRVVWGVLAAGVLLTAVLLAFGRFFGAAASAPTPPALLVIAPTNAPSPTPAGQTTPTSAAAEQPPIDTATAVPTATTTQLPTPPPTFTPAPTASATLPPTAVPLVVVNVLRLNVRQGPGTEYPIIGEITQSGRYEMVGQSANGEWWQLCCLAGEPGWVIGAAVSVEGDTANVPIVRVPPVVEGEG